MSTGRAVATSKVDIFARLLSDAPQLDAYGDRARHVLAVTAALFADRGAAATSIRDITRACRLTPGAFYRHFASKDDALYVLVDLGHDRMERRIADAAAVTGPDARQQLAAFVEAYVSGHLEQPELSRLVRREYVHLSPTRRTEVVRRRRALRSRLVDLLSAGVAQGRLRLPDDVDDHTRIAVMLLDMCSRTSEWYQPDSVRSSADLCKLYVTAALRLVDAVA